MRDAVRSILLGFGILTAIFVRAQETTSTDLTATDWATAPDWQVALQAIEQVPPMPAADATNGVTFWSAEHNPASNEPWPPLPVNVSGRPLWDLGDGTYLLDDMGYNYGAVKQHKTTIKTASSSGMVMAADVDPSLPGDGDGSTNDYSFPALEGLNPDYGTNLYIAQMSQSAGMYSGIVSNTVSGIEYELQYIYDLESTNGWQSANWLFYGAAETNWTAFSVPMISPTNMFFRVRSWASADDGSDLPLWWEEEYYGTNLVDANAQDSAGDGWTIYQKYEMGVPPATFTTPPTPQEVTSSYDPNTDLVSVNWQSASGPVTSYTVNIDGNNYSVSAGSTSFQNNISEDDAYNDPAESGPNTYIGDVTVKANYAGGDSSGASVPLQGLTDSSIPNYLAPGQNGRAYLTLSTLPPGTTAVQVSRVDFYAEQFEGDSSYDTNFVIPVSAFTNGVAAFPAQWLEAYPIDGYGASEYEWWIQTLDSQGNLSAATHLNSAYYTEGDDPFYNDYSGTSATWPTEPWFDGREQLKQNLTFLLRAGLNGMPFQFTEFYTNGTSPVTFVYPTNYAQASFYDFDFDPYIDPVAGLAVFRPFGENYLYRNFAFDLSDMDTNGVTSCFDNYYSDAEQYGLAMLPPFGFTFQPPSTSGTTIAPILSSAQSQWLYTYRADGAGWSTVALNESGTPITYQMESDVANTFGLGFLSTESAWGNTSPDTQTFYPGNIITNGAFYYQTAQPELQTVEYDFWNPNADYYDSGSGYWIPSQILPGMPGFSPTNQSQLQIAGVGQQGVRVAGYAKEELLNGYSGVYGYLGQYFTNAYEIDANGSVTTNQTGIVSSYGDFFATQPGPTALVTMPDPDTGAQGTTTVYCVSLALDGNHDGNMDLNFGGTDATSPIKPYVFWCNNNYDRYVLDSDDGVFYDDDVAANSSDAACPYIPNTPTPDCNFLDGAGHRVIPNIRDLQDFARLWVCGVTSNLLASLPVGSTISLNWGDVGSPNPANPTIDMFQAADADGGLGYLTNVTTSDAQVDSGSYPCIGRIGPGSNLVLNASAFANNWAGNYFVWCGVSNGTGGLNLTIADSSGNILAKSTAYIQIVDIKQMYERWTVGDNPGFWPTNEATLASEDLPLGVPDFQYSPSTDTNTPYILLVHGWNADRWEKDRFAESAFKRLYWQGYQGRFGEFRWPTEYGFKGISSLATNPNEKDNFDRSEYQAWQSGAGLLNKLNDLNSEYPGHVYMLAHSMGNIVASEALRLAGTNQFVNTYVASQAAVSAHTYDTNVPDYSFVYSGWSSFASAPNIYGNWFLGNNGHGAGQVINFYNTNDYALQRSVWQLNQLLKPDQYVLLRGTYWDYSYNGLTNDPPPWNHFEKDASFQINNDVQFDIVNVLTNRYEVMALAAESWTTALGATPNVHNVADTIYLGRSTPSRIWPVDTTGNNYSAHFWHSAEFRGDYWEETGYWAELLGPDAFDLK